MATAMHSSAPSPNEERAGGSAPVPLPGPVVFGRVREHGRLHRQHVDGRIVAGHELLADARVLGPAMKSKIAASSGVITRSNCTRGCSESGVCVLPETPLPQTGSRFF